MSKPTVQIHIHDVHIFRDEHTHGSSELKAIVNVELPELGIRILGIQLVRYRRSGDWACNSPAGRNRQGNRVLSIQHGGEIARAVLEAALPVYWEKLKERQAEEQTAA